MDKIIILGTANSVAAPGHENTHMVFLAGGRTILVDCPGSPIARLKQAGVDPLSLTDLVLTHFHPDHLSGAPLLLVDLWLMGRTAPLDLYGLAVTLDLFEANMELYDWKKWPGFYEVRFHRLASGRKNVLIETDKLKLFAAEVCHLVPTIGVRLEHYPSGKSAAYSCDTEPCPSLLDLASGVDYLLHEATGASKGHTSPAQAGEVAAKAGAKSLYLIHYPPAVDQSGVAGRNQADILGRGFDGTRFYGIASGLRITSPGEKAPTHCFQSGGG